MHEYAGKDLKNSAVCGQKRLWVKSGRFKIVPLVEKNPFHETWETAECVLFLFNFSDTIKISYCPLRTGLHRDCAFESATAGLRS